MDRGPADIRVLHVDEDPASVQQTAETLEESDSRLDVTTATDTDTGLSIVRRVAKAHGWSATITDSEDGGARFDFTGVDVVEDA